MSLFNRLSRKYVRTIKREIGDIFSAKGLWFPQTMEEIQEKDTVFQSIYVNQKLQFLSKAGTTSFIRICEIIHQNEQFADLASYEDISRSVSTEIGIWFSRKLIPNTEEFIDELEKKINQTIHEHFYACEIRGITFNDIESICIDRKVIKPFNTLDFDRLTSSNEILKKLVLEKYSGKLIITGAELGTRSVSEEKFYHNADWCLSIIRLYSCIIFEGASIDTMDIKLVSDNSDPIGENRCFGWSGHDKELSASLSSNRCQEFSVDEEVLKVFENPLAFTEMSCLLDKSNKNEIEIALVKSIYWVGEAHKDLSQPSAWVKLWCALECFFSLGDGNIIEHNARGIASLMLYGNLEHLNYHDYKELKSTIKKYYKIRCKVVHNGEYQTIDIRSLREMAFITACVVVEIVSLVNRGFTNLKQIKEESHRLDLSKIDTPASIMVSIKLSISNYLRKWRL